MLIGMYMHGDMHSQSMSSRMYRGGVTDDSPASRIADALARLRGARALSPGGARAAGRGGEPRLGGPRGPRSWGAVTPDSLDGLREEIARRRTGAHAFGPGGHGGPWGRSQARVRLLEVLAESGSPRSVGDLAEQLHVDQPRASRIVQSAVELGLARREADPADARRTLIALTEQGRAAVAQARGARADAVQQALSAFSPAEQAQLAELLTRLADAWPRPGR